MAGEADRFDEFDSDLSQVRAFWEKTLGAEERARLADNIGGHAKDTQAFIQVGGLWGLASLQMNGPEATQAFIQVGVL